MKGFLLFLLVFCLAYPRAQEIRYAALEGSGDRSSSFDIIGRLGKQILIYRNTRGRHYLSVLNNDMVSLRKVDLAFLPRRVLKVDFLKVDNQLMLFYQHENSGVLYCNLVKFNADVKIVQEPTTLDSVVIADARDIGLYTILQSQQGARIMLMQPLVNNAQLFEINTNLFDGNMILLKKAGIIIGSPGGEEQIKDFMLTNNGDLVFSRAIARRESENLRRVDVLIKPALEDTIRFASIRFGDLAIRNLKMQIDNRNNRVLVATLFGAGKRSDIAGFFSASVRIENNTIAAGQNIYFSDSLKNEAKTRSNGIKTAFNEFAIDQIIPYTQGGYALVMERRYSEGGRGLDRVLNPYLDNSLPGRMQYNGLTGDGPVFTMTKTPYEPFRMPIDPKSIMKNMAGHVLLFSLDSAGLEEGHQLLRKAQQEDNTANFLSYCILKTGSELKFLFNQKEKSGLLLNAVAWKTGERIRRLPVLKDLRPDYRFMTKYASQIGPSEIIIPCLNNGFLSFARIQF